MQTDDPWTVHDTDEGFILRYDGLPWPMSPKADEQAAREYLERVRERYDSDSVARLMCSE